LKGQTLKKSHFSGVHFSCERDGQPNFKFDINSEVALMYRLMPRKPHFLGLLAIFDTTPIGRFFKASRSVHSRIQHKGAGVWVSLDRHSLHCAACKI
jgi:hypothetical protein